MRRPLLNILTALSLLLTIATLTFWLHSRLTPGGSLTYNWYPSPNHPHELRLDSTNGSLTFLYLHSDTSAIPNELSLKSPGLSANAHPALTEMPGAYLPPPPPLTTLGFSASHTTSAQYGVPSSTRTFTLPLWPLLLLSLLLPAHRLYTRLSHPRAPTAVPA